MDATEAAKEVAAKTGGTAFNMLVSAKSSESFSVQIQPENTGIAVAAGLGVGLGVAAWCLVKYYSRSEKNNIGDIHRDPLLHCSTAASFPEFLEDNKSGKVKERLTRSEIFKERDMKEEEVFTNLTNKDAAVATASGTSQFLNDSSQHELPWKWEQNSEIHKAKYQRLLEYGQRYPEKIKEINGVRVCCIEDFLIGTGCGGTRVYIGLAKDGCEKAVKRLLKENCAHLGCQEKKILNTVNAMNSKYVVRYWFYDDETDEDFAYLIEALCEETLAQYVAKRTKQDLINEGPVIVRQILKGLSDLQCGPQPVIHRDLEPSNIMRNVSGNWLLVDFGISRTLAEEQTTYRGDQQGTIFWRAVESYPPKEEPRSDWVRYKKKSDIQVAGMVAFYILTKGKHAFGPMEERVLNLRDGNPVGLAELPDPVGTVANDLISWMLQHKPEDRPSAEEALKHPYLQPAKNQFELLLWNSSGNMLDIKMTNSKSNLLSNLNNDPLLPFDWKAKINHDVMTYLCTDEIPRRVVTYGGEWTECLRLIRNTIRHWNDRPHPRPEAHSIVGNPQEYFFKLFPTLPVVIHRIIRSSDGKERDPAKIIYGRIKIDERGGVKIDERGGCVAFSAACAFLQFPPEAVSEPVTLTCSRVRYKNCAVKGDTFCSRILKIEPEGIEFKKPVAVFLAHSGAEDGPYADYYELVVQKLKGECEDLKTERISKPEDLPPKLVSNFDDVIKDLPFAKATIVETCTLVVAGRIRSEEIVIQPTEPCVHSKAYGNESELKITFPVGAVKEECSLSVQLFPADEILDTNTCLNEDLICFPIIEVSGQEEPFLTLVDVELIYSHDDVADLNETFFPIGQTFPFSNKYGVLLRNHKDSQAKHKWKNAKDDKNAEMTRLQKNKLKITFSVEHFCKRSPIVKKHEKANVENIEESNSSVYSSSKLHNAIVLAVQDIGDETNKITTVLASKTDWKDVKRDWEFRGIGFEKRLSCDEKVYFCVWYEQDHLNLEDDFLSFIPDNISERPNAIDVGINLSDKFMRFLSERCEKENHETTKINDDTVTKVQIQTRNSTTISGNQSNPAVPTASGTSQHGVSVSPNNQSSSYPSADESQNEVVDAIKSNCKVFEEKLEAKFKDKLRIIGDMIKQPRGGKAMEVVDVVGPGTTVMASLACGIAVALGCTTFGASSFAGAAVAGTVLAVKQFDKRRRKANAEVIESKLRKVVSSALECIVKEVGKELSRIFEFQLFMLKDEKQLEILAHHAVDLMFDLKDGEIFDRNTLLKKVLKGRKDKKDKLTTRDGKENWCVQDVFRKTGLRKAVPTSDDFSRVKFEYFVKPDGSCDVQRYGYRDQMLETLRVKEGATIETNVSCKACADCFSDSTCTNRTYFVASDVDEDYTERQLEASIYQPLHFLVQCPKVLERFACSIKNTAPDKNKRSLVNYVSEMYSRSLNSTLTPVYRPHSPSRVPDLTKANFRGCDFSHADFTGSKLDGCDFTECTIFFGIFEKASLNGSTFVETHISHCNFMSAQAQYCNWTKVKVLYSNMRGTDLRNSKNQLGGNEWTKTCLSEAITDDSAASDPHDGQDGNGEVENHDDIESSPDETEV